MLVLVFPMLASLTSCSDDNDEPSPFNEQEKEILKEYKSGSTAKLFKEEAFDMFEKNYETGDKWVIVDLHGIFGLTYNYLGSFIVCGGASYTKLNLYYDAMQYSDVTDVWFYYGKYLASFDKKVPEIYIRHADCIDLEKGKVRIGPYDNDIVSVSDGKMRLYAYREFCNGNGDPIYHRYDRTFSVTDLDGFNPQEIAAVDSEHDGILYIIRTARATFGDILDVSKIPGYSKYDRDIDLAALEAKYTR